MNGGPSGFHNAPVTKTFVIACALFTVFFGMQGRSSTVGLSYQDVFKRLRLGRLIAASFAFSSTPELIFGLYLLYYFRVFERQIGSNKYSIFVLFSMLITTLFGVVALALLKDPTLGVLASGPFGLIFSSFIPFYFDIPVTTRFRIFGFRFSDKSFIYLAGLQLLLSSWKRSLLPGICGILAGFLYRLNAFGIRKIKMGQHLSHPQFGAALGLADQGNTRGPIFPLFPEIVASFFSRLSWPSFSGGSPSTVSSGNIAGNVPSFVSRQVENNYPSAAPLASALEPAEDLIATLVSMGFDRNSARQALVQARNDINAATNILLEAQSH